MDQGGRLREAGHDLRTVLGFLQERPINPSATIFDGRTIQSTPVSGHRVGCDGSKRKKGAKVHATVDRLRHLLPLKITTANERERA
jgi:hypothetical protein